MSHGIFPWFLPILGKPPFSRPITPRIPIPPMLERRWETTDQSSGRMEPVGGWPPPRVGRSSTEAKLAYLRWVTSFGLLEGAYVVLSLRRSDLIYVCPCSPLFQDLILLVSGSSPLGLVPNVYNVVFHVYFRLIFVQS